MDYIIRDEDFCIYEYQNNQVTIFRMSLNRYFNDFLTNRFSSLDGNNFSMKSLFQYVSMIPIFINEETLLFPIYGSRSKRSLWINYHEVKSFHIQSNKEIILTFYNHSQMKLLKNTSFLRQIKRCEEILSFFYEKETSRKCFHILKSNTFE